LNLAINSVDQPQDWASFFDASLRPHLATGLGVRRAIGQRRPLKKAAQIFPCNFSLTKIVARAKRFPPQSRHNFTRLCVFPTLADDSSTNTMRRQMRRGGVVHGGPQ